ncbi:MAG TPA: ribonuclease P protein component [Casimicrobiaceae bacterium]
MTRRHRLRGAAAFAAVLRRGQRLDGARLQLVALASDGGAGRVGYVVGARLLSRAVDRNRLKRMLREAIRVRRPALEAFDLVVRLRKPCARKDLRDALAEASELLDALALRAPERRR